MATAPVSWALSVAGNPKSLAAWGITAATLTRRSLDTDELTLSLRADVLGAAPMAYGAAVSLYRDGVHYFSGTVTSVGASGDPRGEIWSIVVSNAWYQLARTMYQQDMVSISPPCNRQVLKTTKVVLFQDNLSGQPVTTGQQIQAAILYALAAGVLLAPGAAPAFVNLPMELAHDLTVADVIRRCLQATPDAVSWCDYSGGVPVLHCGQRATLPAVDLDFETTPKTIEEFSVRRRDDLVPAGVRFNYISALGCSADTGSGCVDPTTGAVNDSPEDVPSGAPQQLARVTRDEAGLASGPGALVISIELADFEQAPPGLAAAYYHSLLTTPWEGSVTLRERECSGTVRPGLALNLTHGAAEWATMRALVQEVRESLLTGQTVITFGPPTHLGPQDFIALAQFARRRPWVQDAFATTRAPGTLEAPNCDAGLDPQWKTLAELLAQNRAAAARAIGGEALGNALTGSAGQFKTIMLQVCEDGEPKTVSVYGP